MKKINEITLYDLMAEDLGVWIKQSNKFGINFQINDETGDILMDAEHVSPQAAQSFAEFCRNYLEAFEGFKQ